ncbi:MAG TPA: hopanoid biosynthesis-associated protein HpnK [Acidobacteriota bacterium]|nr:hopanoid biosynthesis-associated protein HpnK [Acidobacteriota bacterium]
MKRIIVTGDDFGLAIPVNEAISRAHSEGILTTASLMVGADGARDAVARARNLPSLRVGLHLVLVEGKPVLPPAEVPDLVNAQGEFSTRLVRAGFNYFFKPGIRRQLEAEIRAQFEAFSNTGLALDHANAHNHMHLHPTILQLMLSVGGEYGLSAVRVPYEPPLSSWRATGRSLAGKVAEWMFLSPWLSLMKRRLRRARLRFNDFIFGMADSGAMTAGVVLKFLAHLPEGVTEMYFHPATRRCPEIDRNMPEYRHEEEFKALTDKSVLEALEAAGALRIAFSDLGE